MATYTEAGRLISVKTPLGHDVLLLVSFTGSEAISQPFSYQLDLIGENKTDIAFDKLLGQKITIEIALPGSKKRYINGVCRRVSQGARDATFTAYSLEIVPAFWLLTRRTQSRIFQRLSAPDIIKKVLDGLEVGFEIQGTFEPRDFCVQYRETDFNFASRLMEEEGIYYFFTHADGAHKMILANTPQGHPDMPVESKIQFEEVKGGTRPEDRINDWRKAQELRSGKSTLWDHCFELPHKHLEAEKVIQETAAAGKVGHKLKVGGNDKLEIYDYPGAYAQRFDGIDRGGGEQPAELQKIFEDNKRTVGIRMQQEALPSLAIEGSGTCRQFVAGHKFMLQGHFNADGQYLLTGVQHTAHLSGNYRSGENLELAYENRFTCIPFELPFRPLRITPRPFVQGTQTAVVVGPPGEEIFTDKYSRVKVQFHWDREGKGDADSSCWVRVGTPLAGRRWGMIHIPRIGQEVIVDFEEGDPDRPIIVGSVYNADQMPAYKLPAHKTKTGIKSYSSPGGGGFNEIRFEDKKGEEQVFVHGEKDMDIRVKNDRREWIGHDRHLIVKRDKHRTVERDEHITIKRDRLAKTDRDDNLTVGGKQAISVGGSRSLGVKGDVIECFQSNHKEDVAGTLHLKAANIILDADAMEIWVGGSSIDMNSGGIWIAGPTVFINSGTGPDLPAVPSSLVSPAQPGETLIAANADPGDKTPTYVNQLAAMTAQQQAADNSPTHDPNAEDNKDKKHWIEIELVDEANHPIPGEPYRITLPDGTTLASGTLDEKGWARVDGIDPGTCKVTFPRLHKDAWKPK
jgi:type VI secretion system secreted protein VgrG